MQPVTTKIAFGPIYNVNIYIYPPHLSPHVQVVKDFCSFILNKRNCVFLFRRLSRLIDGFCSDWEIPGGNCLTPTGLRWDDYNKFTLINMSGVQGAPGWLFDRDYFISQYKDPVIH